MNTHFLWIMMFGSWFVIFKFLGNVFTQPYGIMMRFSLQTGIFELGPSVNPHLTISDYICITLNETFHLKNTL